MRFTWENISERRILVSNFDMTCNSLCEFNTLDWLLRVWALPENRLRRLHVLKYTTQLSCIRWSTSSRSSFQLMTGVTVDIRSLRSLVTFVTVDNRLPYIFVLQHGYCTFVIILFRLFTWLFINLTMCIWALFPKSASTFGLVEQAFWRVRPFTEWIGASSFEVILTKPSRRSTAGTSASGTSGSRRISLILLLGRIRRRIRLSQFSTLINIVAETEIVSSRTLPVGLPLPTISNIFFVHAVLSPDSWPRRSSQNFRFWLQSSYFEFPARYFFSPSFSICDNQVLFSSDESPGHTIPIRSWVSQTLVFLICTILPRCHQVGFSSQTIKFRPTLSRILEYRHFEDW